jgi:hypothetical protein
MVEEESTPSRTWILVKRYWLFVFVPIFLVLAYIHISHIPPKYRVSTRLALKNGDAASAANEIKSKTLIGEALVQLPFRLSFYNDTLPQKEVYPDSVPIKLMFSSLTNTHPQSGIAVQPMKNGQVAVSYGDTIVNYGYGDLVTEPYGKFKVVMRHGMKPDNQNYIVRINDMSELLDRIYNDMKVDVDEQNNALAVSVVTGNAAIGVDLLKKLVRLDNQAHHITAKPDNYAATPVVKEMETEVEVPQPRKPNVDINGLRAKAERLRHEISSLDARKNNPSVSDADQKTAPTDQAKMYQEMKSSVRRPVTEYVQVPHQDEIDDPDLNDDVSQYNDAQSYRHTLMSSPQKNRMQIDSINRRLMVLQSQIVQELNGDIKNAPAHRTQHRAPTDIKAIIREKQDALAKVDADINAAKREASIKPIARVPKVRHVRSKHIAPPIEQIARAGLAIIDKPENNIKLVPPNFALIYGIAFLLGLCIPLGWLAIQKIWHVGSNRTLIDREKITERIHDIFSVKQID